RGGFHGRLPTQPVCHKALKNKLPEETWNRKKPSIDHLRVFGYKVYSHTPKEKRNKLDAKPIEGIFLGYYEDSKAWRLYNAASDGNINSRDVTFTEMELPEPVGESASENVQVELNTQEEPGEGLTSDITNGKITDQMEGKYNFRRSGRTRRPPNK